MLSKVKYFRTKVLPYDTKVQYSTCTRTDVYLRVCTVNRFSEFFSPSKVKVANLNPKCGLLQP